jgi:tRNA dimethylallyltransferase
VQRALEVHLVSGASMTAHLRHGARVFPLPVLKLARSPRERGTLHTRIEGRFDAMLAQGFIGEVAALMARGDLKPDLPSMRCVGYRQVWAHLAGECDAAEMRYRAVVATRQLAKRQFTWLRAEPEVHWLWDDEAPRREAVQLVRRALDSA